MKPNKNDKKRPVGTGDSYYARFMRMTDAQRDAEVARFDKEELGTPGRPLTTADKARHRRARRGRPKVEKGAKRVLVTIERDLLTRVDSLAKQQGISRAQLVARGLRHEVADMLR